MNEGDRPVALRPLRPPRAPRTSEEEPSILWHDDRSVSLTLQESRLPVQPRTFDEAGIPPGRGETDESQRGMALGRRAGFLALLFILLWIARSTELFLLFRDHSGQTSWWRLAILQAPLWLTLLLGCALILRLARRYPYEGWHKGRTVAIHGIAILGLTMTLPVVDLLLSVPGMILFQSWDHAWETFHRLTWRNLHGVAVMVPPFYLLVVSLSWFWRYYQTMREKELQAADLRAQLAQAQLQALKMQMNPHFLFNTLNSISTLLRVDIEAAESTLEQLAILLRRSLEATEVQEVQLREELEFIRDYLELEQIRFANRLRLEWAIEPSTEGALVPHLILQPLVENAIKHGFWPTAKPGLIRISSRLVGQELHLAVEDDGAGLAPGRAEGVGLSNSRARLRQLYGTAASLDLLPRLPQGVRATVVLPFDTSPRVAAPLGASTTRETP